MNKLIISLVIGLCFSSAFSKDIPFVLMNNSNYSLSLNQLDSIEYTANAGLALTYQNYLYVIFEISDSEAKHILELSDSENLVEAMNKVISPEKKSDKLKALRQALDINVNSSNLTLLDEKKDKISLIIRSQGERERAYICNYYTCTLITTTNGTIQDLLAQTKSTD